MNISSHVGLDPEITLKLNIIGRSVNCTGSPGLIFGSLRVGVLQSVYHQLMLIHSDKHLRQEKKTLWQIQ